MPGNYHNSNRQQPSQLQRQLYDRSYKKQIVHGTLAAATVATVTLNADYQTIEVENRGSGDIFFTVDGSAPTVNGADNYVVAATSGDADRRVIRAPDNNGQPVVVKLISSGTPAYSVFGSSN